MLALASMAIAATVGIGIISTPLFGSLILIFIQGETKSLFESEIFGNSARVISGNVSVTSRAVSIQTKNAILFPISANKAFKPETYVS